MKIGIQTAERQHQWLWRVCQNCKMVKRQSRALWPACHLIKNKDFLKEQTSSWECRKTIVKVLSNYFIWSNWFSGPNFVFSFWTNFWITTYQNFDIQSNCNYYVNSDYLIICFEHIITSFIPEWTNPKCLLVKVNLKTNTKLR